MAQALGQSYYSQKMIPKAQEEYEKAIALRPDLPGLPLELGEIYTATSQWTNAEEQFRHETELQPGNAEAAYRLGDAFSHQGKMKEAAEELRLSNSLHPDMPETLYALGRALVISDPNEAERGLDRVIAIHKQSPLAGQAYLQLATCHRNKERMNWRFRYGAVQTHSECYIEAGTVKMTESWVDRPSKLKPSLSQQAGHFVNWNQSRIRW